MANSPPPVQSRFKNLCQEFYLEAHQTCYHATKHSHTLKVDLDDTIVGYEYRARLACVMTSHQTVSCKLDPRHPHDTCGCRN